MGDGSTTFNVPDKRGRASFGKDDMGGSAASRLTSAGMSPDGVTLGATGGAQTHTNTTGEMAAHGHSLYSAGPSQSGSSVAGLDIAGVTGAVGGFFTPDGYTANTPNGGNPYVQSTGSGTAYSILPPGIVCNYILKT